MKRALVAVLILSACTTTEKVWVKPNANQENFKIDAAQCRAKASSVRGASAMQVAAVFNSCMHSRGWYIEEWRIE